MRVLRAPAWVREAVAARIKILEPRRLPRGGIALNDLARGIVWHRTGFQPIVTLKVALVTPNTVAIRDVSGSFLGRSSDDSHRLKRVEEVLDVACEETAALDGHQKEIVQFSGARVVQEVSEHGRGLAIVDVGVRHCFVAAWDWATSH